MNFASRYLSDVEEPGVRDIIHRLAGMDGGVLSPERVVDGCLDLLGPIDVDLAEGDGRSESERRIAEVLSRIVSSRQFQLA